jgi:ABC-2 type transport system permease protein
VTTSEAALTSEVDAPVGSAGAAPQGAGWAVMWRIELAKLAAQPRVRIAMGACLVGPALFAVALSVQSSVPSDTLFGRWVHTSGWALPLVVLGFSGQWVLPILVSIVAGDTCAGEDHHHTWTLLLTRSRSRGEVFAGKILAVGVYAGAVVVLLGLSATVAGVVCTGTQPLVGLSGATLSTSAALHAVVLSWVVAIPPTLAISAIAVLASVVSRNSWVGVVSPVLVVLILNLVALLSAIDPVRPYLPTTGFFAWHGLARVGTYTGPLDESLLVSAAWIVVCLLAAATILARRDVVDA